MAPTLFESIAKAYHNRHCRRGDYVDHHPVYRTAAPWDEESHDHKKHDLKLVAKIIDDYRKLLDQRDNEHKFNIHLHGVDDRRRRDFY